MEKFDQKNRGYGCSADKFGAYMSSLTKSLEKHQDHTVNV